MQLETGCLAPRDYVIDRHVIGKTGERTTDIGAREAFIVI
jgi:hypothetical protein